MVDQIEMSLDDIIKTTRSLKVRKGSAPTRRGGRGGSSRGSGGGRPLHKGGRSIQAGDGTQRQGINGSGNSSVLKDRNHGGIQKPKFARGDANIAWKRNMYDGPKRGGGGLKTSNIGGPAKILVSNLDYGVSESDMHDLFVDLGPLKSASLHYDRSGRSLGTADIVFERRTDAVKAMRQYNGVLLDGRPMNIQLTTSDVPSVVITARLGTITSTSRTPNRNTHRGGAGGPKRGSAPRTGGHPAVPRSAVGNPRRGGAGGPKRGLSPGTEEGPVVSRAAVGTTRRGGAGGPRRGSAQYTGGPRGRRNAYKTTKMTAEELDAELDAYASEHITNVLQKTEDVSNINLEIK